jgi:hypothetical protein
VWKPSPLLQSPIILEIGNANLQPGLTHTNKLSFGSHIKKTKDNSEHVIAHIVKGTKFLILFFVFCFWKRIVLPDSRSLQPLLLLLQRRRSSQNFNKKKTNKQRTLVERRKEGFTTSVFFCFVVGLFQKKKNSFSYEVVTTCGSCFSLLICSDFGNDGN